MKSIYQKLVLMLCITLITMAGLLPMNHSSMVAAADHKALSSKLH